MILCLCISIALSACQDQKTARVPEKEILDTLSVEFQHDRFKRLECVGSSPIFKLLDEPKPGRKNDWQRKVSPSEIDLTFRAFLDVANQEKQIVGHLKVYAGHSRPWLSDRDIIKFSARMNEWYFVNPGDDIDKYCD